MYQDLDDIIIGLESLSPGIFMELVYFYHELCKVSPLDLHFHLLCVKPRGDVLCYLRLDYSISSIIPLKDGYIYAGVIHNVLEGSKNPWIQDYNHYIRVFISLRDIDHQYYGIIVSPSFLEYNHRLRLPSDILIKLIREEFTSLPPGNLNVEEFIQLLKLYFLHRGVSCLIFPMRVITFMQEYETYLERFRRDPGLPREFFIRAIDSGEYICAVAVSKNY